MGTSTLNGTVFAEMVKAGAAELNLFRQIVNDLNVFPIPDGDTGDNMFMTIESGVNNIDAGNTENLGQTARTIADGMLSGARGNSGAILSQIFAGISNGFEGLATADIDGISRAFDCGVTQAYKAVKEPVEGTILTVFKDAVNYANSMATKASTVESFLDDLIRELYESLRRTPELLAVLKEAGVVDSGGAGFVYIAEGMKKALTGEAASLDKNTSEKKSAPAIDISTFTEDSELQFGYCTEFLLRLQNKKCDVKNFDIKTITDFLDTVGDSVVAFKDGSIVKIHVHTFNPGNVLNFCQKFGEFLTLKIENMTLQHNETTVRNNFQMRTKPRKNFGLVCCAAGEGIKRTFLDIGCDAVVDGGQSMNPSVGDFLNAFKEINAGTIFVFPNNGNIIMTANQAADLYKDAKVVVIPTHAVGEGYAAVSMFEPDGTEEEVLEILKEAASSAKTAMVSRAVRDTEKDGVKVVKDDYIGFVGDNIYTDCALRNDAAFELAGKIGAGSFDVMIVFRGSDVSKSESDELASKLEKAFRSTEVIFVDGGQPIFDYIMILM